MEIRQLRTFVTAARSGNLGQASRELRYAPSSVTAQIKALEAGLGAALFDRVGRGVLLSDAGRALLPYAEEILRLDHEGRAAVDALDTGVGGLRGQLCVGAPDSLCAYRLPAVIRAFHAVHPGVRLTFRPADRAEILDDLAAGTVDVAFLLEEPLHLAALEVEVMVTEPMRLVAHPADDLATLRTVRTEDLADRTVLMLEPGCAQQQVFQRRLDAAGVRPAGTVEFTSVEAVKRCVGAGLGVAAVPAFALTDELARGELVTLPWTESDLGLSTQLARHPHRRPSAALTALIDTARTLWTDAASSECPIR